MKPHHSQHSLKERVVVITGAGGGIGRAVTLACARQGARLLLNDLGCDLQGNGADASVVEAVAEQARQHSQHGQHGAEVLTDAHDVSQPEHAAALVTHAQEAYGRVDGVVALAGIQHIQRLARTDDDDLARAWRVHVAGPYALLRAAANVMASNADGGAVVLTSGTAAFTGQARQSVQATVSGAIAGLVRSAAIELRKQNIRVHAIVPTARTRQTETLPLFKSIQPGSMTPEHIAPAITCLLSHRADALSGDMVGVAGERLYSVQSRETTGVFSEDGRPLTKEAILQHWNSV